MMWKANDMFNRASTNVSDRQTDKIVVAFFCTLQWYCAVKLKYTATDNTVFAMISIDRNRALWV